MSATLPEPEQIRGSVHAVVFHNEENGYSIMQVEAGPDGRVTVLGRLPAVTAGEEVRAYGRWRDNRRFGRQFEAERIEAVAPQSAEGVERFLASGLIEGIGKTYAKRIVEKFGSETLRIIEEASQRLEEVEGIGRARRRTIKESWKRQKAVREVMIFLHEHGLSTARALRLYKNYGAEAVNVLRADPYQLAKDLSGVGFKTADEIARKMGCAEDSPQRIDAGILYALDQAESDGHCALPRERLLEVAVGLLGVAPEAAETELDRLVADGRLRLRSAGGEAGTKGSLVFTPELDKAERAVAAKVQELLLGAPTLPEFDGSAALRWFEREEGVSLGKDQAAAVVEAMRHRILVVTGGPGTGKTTILRAVLKILAAKRVRPILCAPTGRASRQLEAATGLPAATIHRTLETQPSGGFARNASHPLEGDLVVVDEASMIDLRLMAQLLAALPRESSLLLVGDVDQLPSVGPGCVLRDLIESARVPVVRLGEIFRQAAGGHIVSAAHAVNEGHCPPLGNEPGSDFFFLERETPEATAATLRHLVTERIPEGFGFDPRDDIQVLTPMHRLSLGTRELNRMLQEALNPAAELKTEIERFGTVFRSGDKVIQVRNNYEKEVFNGDIGHIAEITHEPVSIYVVFDGHRVRYEPGELDELQPAYAITVHKSQGSEFPAVVIPLAGQHWMMLQRNLLYTAITRGRRLVILVGERSALERAVSNRSGGERFTALRERLGTV